MQKGLRGHILRWFFDAVGSVPVDRDALSSGKGALQAGLEILRQGSGFAIYPEGTRSKDGLLHPGKQGAAWLAVESGCPVIPVGLKGTQHLLTRRGLRERGIVTVRVGEIGRASCREGGGRAEGGRGREQKEREAGATG